MDYNFEQPFQGLYSSNHADIAGSYYPQVLAYMEKNDVLAHKTQFVHYSIHFK